MDIYIGFDSAWTDNPKAPGAICAVGVENDRCARFDAPQLVSFHQALTFVQKARSENGVTLIALDQPTVVPNLTSMRPVERAAASLISWLGRGVQPSNRGRLGMFCDASPIWPFLTALGAEERPERARIATNGLYPMEVFPALALASLDSQFFGWLRAPRYNPHRKKTFRMADWSVWQKPPPENLIYSVAMSLRNGAATLRTWPSLGRRTKISWIPCCAY